MTQNELTNNETCEILCAPEATDSVEDIDFDDPDEDFDPDTERRFIEDYVQAWTKNRGANEKKE
jgi:hypothetical protein